MKTHLRVLIALAFFAGSAPVWAQATTTISALPAASAPLADTEVAPIVQSGATRKATVAQLKVAYQGTSAPTLPILGQFWFDTTASPSLVLKQYDGASWVTWGTLNTSAHTWTPASGGGNATFGTPSGNVTDDFVSMANTTTGVKDSGKNANSFAAPGTGAVITTSQSPTATEFNQNCKLLTVNATSLTINLPLSTTLQANGGCYWVSNPSPFTVSIAPNAADNINGGTTGAPVTFPANQSAPVTTDGGGHMFIPIPTGGGGTPCTSIALSLQYNNAGSFGCVTGSSWNGTTLGVPPLSVGGNIDLSGAVSRNILMNSQSEIDAGGLTMLAFFGGQMFLGKDLVSGSGAYLPFVTASSTVPSLVTHGSNGTNTSTGWGGGSDTRVDGIVSNVDIVSMTSAGWIMQSGVIGLKGYAFASLPGSPAAGYEAYVTDQTAACSFGATPVGGGSNKCKVWYNGTGWVDG